MIDTLHTWSGPRGNGVSVDFGTGPATGPLELLGLTTRLCVIGVQGREEPWLADSLPMSLIRQSRFRDLDVVIEQVRISNRDACAVLPGLDSSVPSRLRDTVRMILASGLLDADVFVVRTAQALECGLDEKVLTALDTFMVDQLGAVVLYPDVVLHSNLAFRAPRSGDPPLPAWAASPESVNALIQHQGERWRDRYQVALLDVVGGQDAELDSAIRSFVGQDLALCRFSGNPVSLGAHGWRSAAAALGAALCARPAFQGGALVGRRIHLGPGRTVSIARMMELGLEDPPSELEPTPSWLASLALHPSRDQATVVSDVTLRRPLGDWPLAAHHTVKLVHRQMIQAAGRFVFRSADEAQAEALAVAVELGVSPLIDTGLLVGLSGGGEPHFSGHVERVPGQPGLSVHVAAQLRPWCHNVQVRINLRPGAQPVLEAT